MATSFITYHDNGFWINDRIMEIACAILCVKIKERNYMHDEKWKEFSDNLLLNAAGARHSHMDLTLEDFITSEKKRMILLEIIEDSIDFLIEKPSIMDVSFIENEILPERHWAENNWDFKLETKRLIKVFLIIELLVQNKFLNKVNDQIIPL